MGGNGKSEVVGAGQESKSGEKSGETEVFQFNGMFLVLGVLASVGRLLGQRFLLRAELADLSS